MNIVYALRLLISCLLVSLAFIFSYSGELDSYYTITMVLVAIGIQFIKPTKYQQNPNDEGQRQSVIVASSSRLNWLSSPIFWLGVPVLFIIFYSVIW